MSNLLTSTKGLVELLPALLAYFQIGSTFYSYRPYFSRSSGGMISSRLATPSDAKAGHERARSTTTCGRPAERRDDTVIDLLDGMLAGTSISHMARYA
jgi:hypothetical protein